MTRIYFEAGERALKKYQSQYNAMTEISNKLSAGQEDLLEKFESMEAKNQEIRNRLFLLEKSVIASKTETIKERLEKSVSQIHIETLDGLNPKLLQAMSKDLIKIADSKLIILVNHDAKFALIITSKDSSINCGDIVKNLALNLGGKGGGNKISAQVTFENIKDLKEFIKSVKESYNDIL